MVFKMGMYSKAAQQRRWMATGAIDKAKVVIIGGGTAGITVAAHLRGHVKGVNDSVIQHFTNPNAN